MTDTHTTPDPARMATLRAAAARAGFDLRTDPMGCCYATRWGQVRVFDSIEDVQAWLLMLGVEIEA